MDIADGVEAVQDRRIHIEKINYPMLYRETASPAEYWAGLQFALERAGSITTRAELT